MFLVWIVFYFTVAKEGGEIGRVVVLLMVGQWAHVPPHVPQEKKNPRQQSVHCDSGIMTVGLYNHAHR